MTGLARLQPLRIIALALIVALAVLALSRLVEPPAPEPAATPGPVRLLASAPQDYASALARLDERLAAAKADAAQRGDEWLFIERLATAHVARARLTGSIDDYAAADAALRRAFAVAPPRTGPHLSRAELDFQLHRLAAAEQWLKLIDGYAVAPDAGEQAEVMGLRGDISLYLGRIDDARMHHARAAELADSPAMAFRSAVLAWRTGDDEAADAAFARALAMQAFVAPETLANIELQRGALALDRGRWEGAEAHVARARRAFPGYWLADAYAAQLIALRGDLPRAIALMESIVRRNGHPTAMDALAAMHRALGNREAAELWAARAGSVWANRLARFPEANWGHAAEHHLAFGDPAKALELARRDAAARPYGGAKIILAWALLANRRPDQALAILAAVEQSGWVSAERHLAAAQAHALLGDGARADAERAKALALNPRALDRGANLIWFH